jgi:hypothetical protein
MHTIFVATWQDGLHRLAGGVPQPELPGQSVLGLADADGGGVLAIVGGHSLRRRSADGVWSELATSEHELYCCVAADEAIYAGTSDAQLLRLQDRDGRAGSASSVAPTGPGSANGALVPLAGFMRVPGRERWYAGTAVIDGHVVGPPLGVRSIAATCDGESLLANIHVGGIARSIDGGATWKPTIDIDADVHQVCAHPTRPELVAAAAAAGLCLSRDGGESWRIERDGLHAHYCSAVAFAGDDVLVAASTGHFAAEGAIYRRALERAGCTPLCGAGGLPRWLDGIVDTGNIAVRGEVLAVADHGGHVYVSADAGRSWQRAAEGLAVPVGVFIAGS